MRWCLVLLVAACGDNAQPPGLDVVAKLPAGTQDLAFQRDGTAVARLGDGSVKELVDGRWRAIDIAGGRAIDFGSDNDGGLLVMSSIPRVLMRVDGGMATPLGGIVIANFVHEPMQVASGNRYVREVAAPERSFVLSGETWAETPPMFFSRPQRATDGSVLAMTAAGVQRDGEIAVWCAQLERATCTQMVLGGDNAEGIVVGADDDLYVGSRKVKLPGHVEIVQIAAGKDLVVVLAKRGGATPMGRFFLYAVRDDAEEIDTIEDRATAATRLAVHDGVVWVGTEQLSKVAL